MTERDEGFEKYQAELAAQAEEEARASDDAAQAAELHAKEQAEIEVMTTAVVKISPEFDSRVALLLTEVQRLKTYADSRVITTEQDAKDATNDLSVMSKLKKSIEEKRSEYVGPLNEYVKSVNGAFKLLTDPLAQADRATRDKLVAYKVEQERKAKEAEEINRQKEELARKEAALNQGVVTINTEPVPVLFVPKHTRSEKGMSQLVENWEYEVIDFAVLPDAYKMPDDTLLKAIAKKYHDQKAVPGIRFFNSPTLRVNPRGDKNDSGDAS